MKYSKYLFFIVVSLIVLSCYEDKGNYKYNEYKKIKIDGIKSGYEVVVFSTLLEIDPIIEHPENYDYLWRIYSNKQSFARPDTLGYEKKLSTKINLAADSYTLMLEVKDKKTGYVERCGTNINGTTAFSTGWYILKEQGDECDLDLHAPSGVMEDLLANKFKKKLKGKATQLSIMASYSYIDSENVRQRNIPVICPFTDDESAILRISDLDLIYDQNSMFFERPKDCIINHFQQGGRNFLVLMTNKGLNYINGLMSGSSGRFGLPGTLDMENGEDLDISKYSYLPSHTYGSMFYDQKNGRFFQLNYSGSFGEFLDNPDDEYKSKNLNMELLFMGRNGGIGNAVLKDKTGSDIYIYNLNFPPFSQVNPVAKVDMVAAEAKIHQAKIFANNFDLPFIYYSSGDNTVHAYRCETKQEIPNVISFPADEKVTLIQHIFWTINTETEKSFNYLVVGTYKDGKYTIYRYEMLAGLPDPDKQPTILTGEGKAVSVQYSSSNLNSGTFKNYSFY